MGKKELCLQITKFKHWFFPQSTKKCGLTIRGKASLAHFFDKNEFMQNCTYKCVCKRHAHASHTQAHPPMKAETQPSFLLFYALHIHILKSATCSMHFISYFFGDRILSSKKQLWTTLSAGKYLATKNEELSLSDAFPTPIFVFVHTMAMKCWS